jgi:type I restriction enzyme S subunit
MLNYETLSFDKCIEKIDYKKKINKKKYLKNGKFPIVSQEDQLISGFWNNPEDVYKIDKPIVIFGDHTRVLKYIDFDFVVGADGTKILKTKPNIIPKYFYYFLLSSNIKSLGYSRHYKLLKKLKLNLPPMSIQEKIVAKLDKIFAEIDKATSAAETNIKNADLLFISYLNKILNYKNGWKNSKLKDICIFINRGISPSYTNQGGTLILNQKCVRNHKVAYDLGRRHDEIKKEIKKERLLIQGDVLVNSTGVGTLGRVAQVKDIIKEKITVDSHVTILRPNTEFLYYKFFGYIMISIEDEIKNSGEGTSGQTELSRIKLSEKFIIKYPEDKNLQKLIVSKLDLIKANSISIKKIMEKKIIELNLLKNSILRQALKGELVKAA